MRGDLAETEAMQALDRGLWDRVGPSVRGLDKALRAIPMALWSPLPALIEGRALLGAGDAAAALPLLDAAVAAAKSVDAGGTLEMAYACRAQAALLAGSSVRTPASVSADPGVVAILSETAGIAALLRADHQHGDPFVRCRGRSVGAARRHGVAGAGPFVAGGGVP